jgi:hypothetical protein
MTKFEVVEQPVFAGAGTTIGGWAITEEGVWRGWQRDREEAEEFARCLEEEDSK